MKITYCDGWFRARKRYTELWDESQARKAYEKRELYTVLVGDPERPHCFIESNIKYIGVEFLDTYLRSYLVYTFQEGEPGRLFMTRMVVREYTDHLDDVSAGTAYYIHPDGGVLIEREEFISYKKSQFEGRIDPTPYWEPYPEFGKYIGLVQERPVPCVKAEGTE